MILEIYILLALLGFVSLILSFILFRWTPRFDLVMDVLAIFFFIMCWSGGPAIERSYTYVISGQVSTGTYQIGTPWLPWIWILPLAISVFWMITLFFDVLPEDLRPSWMWIK